MMSSICFISIFVIVKLLGEIHCSCPSEREPALQIVYVMDRTKSCYNFVLSVSNMLEQLEAKVIKKVRTHFSSGVTLFGDWPTNEGADTGVEETKHGQPHSLKHLCFKVSRHLQDIYISHPRHYFFLKSMKPVISGGKENSLAALAFAATAKPHILLWNPSNDQKQVRKFLLLITDQDYGNMSNPDPTRRDFVGNGTDTCENSKAPTIPVVGRVLKEKGMSVIALLSTYLVPNLLNIYKSHFSNMPDVPFCGIGLNVKNYKSDGKIIIDKVMGCLKRLGVKCA